MASIMLATMQEELPPNQTSGKIVVVTTWDALYDLPDFVKTVPKEAVTVGSIYGRYEMASREKKPCAISACRTRHFIGRIVRLASGQLTNIGSRCGKKYFPFDWDRIDKVFRERQALEDRSAALVDLRAKVERAAGELNYRHKKFEWFKRAMDTWMSQVPPQVVDEIYKRAERNEPDITRTRKLSDDEFERAQLTGQKTRIVEEVLGSFRGLRVFRPGFNPKLLVHRLENIFSKVRGLKGPDDPAYRIVVKIAQEIPALMEHAAIGLADAEQFFASANLARLVHCKWARETRLIGVSIDDDGTVRATKRN